MLVEFIAQDGTARQHLAHLGCDRGGRLPAALLRVHEPGGDLVIGPAAFALHGYRIASATAKERRRLREGGFRV